MTQLKNHFLLFMFLSLFSIQSFACACPDAEGYTRACCYPPYPPK